MPELVEILTESNPWWANRGFESGIQREKYIIKIKKCLENGDLTVLNGVRRSGKTTLLYQLIRGLIETEKVPPEKILFVNFENPAFVFLENPLQEVLEAYRRDVCSEKGTCLIFDEVQNLQGWEEEIQALQKINEHRIILSVSPSRLLDCKLMALMYGRYQKIQVFPLDFSEYLLFREVLPGTKLNTEEALKENKYRIMNLLKTYLHEGGFPRVVLEKEEILKKEHLQGHFDGIMYRDIVLRSEVRNASVLQELVCHLLSDFTDSYSYRQLGNLLKLDFSTLKEYIYYSGQANLLFEVQAFNPSGKTGGRKNKKIYCIDNGLRNSVASEVFESESKLAENLVYIELMRRGCEAFYWENGKEGAHFVMEDDDGKLTALSVIYKDRIEPGEIKPILAFSKAFGADVKELVLITKDTEKEEDGIKYIPLWKWLLDSN
ncbi:ATP-binding protein [Methanosarcina sp. KYL-1]|uniref:ATP-binding protein n=1 Tax=Methanosarcina sp. KYL-1 TaxID=2602068 RepID=UPI00210122E8|nr:ATP-binding protein [Methanosarcina sp. KYL-1]MCQ1534603.1 ATP-binding protein [Methanosarcina sp. KYL-1]